MDSARILNKPRSNLFLFVFMCGCSRRTRESTHNIVVAMYQKMQSTIRINFPF